MDIKTSDDILLNSLRFALGKRLAGTDGDLSVESLVGWVKAGRCPDPQWRGTVCELFWELTADEFGGLLWHPELTPKEVGDFVRHTNAHMPVLPGMSVPNEALVNMLRLMLPDEDWPETPDDRDTEWRAKDLAFGPEHLW